MFDTLAEKPAAISDHAIIVNPDDNVAVVKNETADGLLVMLPNGDVVEVAKASGEIQTKAEILKHREFFNSGPSKPSHSKVL